MLNIRLHLTTIIALRCAMFFSRNDDRASLPYVLLFCDDCAHEQARERYMTRVDMRRHASTARTCWRERITLKWRYAPRAKRRQKKYLGRSRTKSPGCTSTLTMMHPRLPMAAMFSSTYVVSGTAGAMFSATVRRTHAGNLPRFVSTLLWNDFRKPDQCCP